MREIAARIETRSRATATITVFQIAAIDGAALPAFTPGAHIDLHLPNDLIRQYSLCGDPADRRHYRIAVLREPASRGGSAWLCDKARVGDELCISALRNNFRLQLARRALLLGGGIGVTPLLPMASQLHRNGADFMLHYYNHSRSRAAFLDELAAVPWANRVALHFSDEADSARQRLAGLLAGIDADTHVYACGPAGFVEHVIACVAQSNLEERQIHYEPFALPDSLKPDFSGPSFQVRLRSSGRVYTIPADVPPTRALEHQGVRIPVSCEEGNCGTCQTGVLEGVPDHRDVYLSEREKAGHRTFMPCCSRALTPLLVLDL